MRFKPQNKLMYLLFSISSFAFSQNWQTHDCNNPNFDVWAPWEDRCIPNKSNWVIRFCSTDGHHFYTNDVNEAKRLFYSHCAETNGFYNLTPCYAPGNWVIEPTGGWLGTGYGLLVYRLLKGGNHLYTTNTSELSFAQSVGWQYEGEIGYLLPSGTGPVYRLRNPGNGDYLYTISISEKNYAQSIGYVFENILGYTSTY